MTLVEMLVSVAITLILVLAVVQVFAVVGANVRTARAAMEVSNDLRSVARQIQRDLDAHTAPARPWADPEASFGYIELVEGPLRDRDFVVDPDSGQPLVAVVGGNEQLVPNAAASFPRDLFLRGVAPRNGTTDPRKDDYDSSFGDLDDMIALTIHSDGKPFVGRDFNGNAVESFDAEVIYWVAFIDLNFDPNNSNYIPYFDSNEPLCLMRRELLVLPNHVPLSNVPLGSAADIDTFVTRFSLVDVSISDRGGAFSTGQFRANSLSDLTNPRYRSLHGFQPAVFEQLFPRAIRPDDHRFDRFILLRDVRGFDMRVYDPLAPVIAVPMAPAAVPNTVPPMAAVVPGDAGYPPQSGASPNVISDLKGASNQWIGRGAYVDMGYAVKFGGDGLPNAQSDRAALGNWFRLPNPPIDPNGNPKGRVSYFSGLPSFRDKPTVTPYAPPDGIRGVGEMFWSPDGKLVDPYRFSSNDPRLALFRQFFFRYDTWSSGFERDGESAELNVPPDRSINGIDDEIDGIAANGVDDPGERDTAPPYDVPLRGVEVRLRAVHYEMRQVRQVSVVSDFMPE